MTENDLIARIEREESAAYGALSGQLAAERKKALEWYFGDLTEELTAEAGRSKAVDTVVADTVETVLPALVKIFCAGDEVVMFSPVGEEDAEQSEQETAYTNHVINKSNWLEVFYAWAKDALLCKNAYVECDYEKKEDALTERYQGLTDEEWTYLAQDTAAEIVEHEERVEPIVAADGQVLGQITLHDAAVKRKSTYGCYRITPIPCEDVLVSTSHRVVCLQDAPFVETRRIVTISALREAGYDIDDDINDTVGTFGEDLPESVVRDRYNETDRKDAEGGASREVLYRRVWVRADVDGDGIAELRHVCLVGRTVLVNEPTDIVPVACLTPMIMSHRHIGRSIADLMMEVQAIKSHLWRTSLDAQYLYIRGRWAIDEAVNVDEMVEARIGGVVRVDGRAGSQGHITPLFAPVSGDANINMMRYADEIGQNRSGVNDYFSGTDANALNKTATGVTQLMGMAQERVLLIARLFAETGVKDLMRIVHALIRKHSDAPQIFRLRNKWVPVDPRGWRERRDMTVSVGLGTGNRMEQIGYLQQIIMLQFQAAAVGLATPLHIFNALSELTKAAGFKESSKFWNDPGQQGFAPPQNPMAQQEAMKLQADVQKTQAQTHMDIQKFQAQAMLEQQKAQHAAELESQRLALEKYKADLQAATDLEIAKYKAEMEAQLEREKLALSAAQTDVSTQLEVQRMQQPQDADRKREARETEHMQGMQQAIESLKPISIEAVRDDMGRLVGSVATYADGSKRQISIRT